MITRQQWLGIVLCIGVGWLAGCTGTQAPESQGPASRATGSHASDSLPPESQGPASQPPAAPGARSGRVSKALVFVVENHSLDQMRADMPYTLRLAQTYGYAGDYHALTHPSLGNYLAIAGGTTFGVTDDDNPVAHQLHGPSVFSQALDAGATAAVYAEGMPDPCAEVNGGDQYVVRHNPWTYFVDDRSDCERFDQSDANLSADIAQGRLPNVGMVIPNLCDDAHDCSLATADDWLRERLDRVLAGPDWRSGRLAVVVTADEDDHHQDNQVLTAVLHPGLDHVVVDEPLTHLSLSRFLSEVVGQPPLREAAGAPSLGAAFGLRVGRHGAR
jgi:acid phosphatase